MMKFMDAVQMIAVAIIAVIVTSGGWYLHNQFIGYPSVAAAAKVEIIQLGEQAAYEARTAIEKERKEIAIRLEEAHRVDLRKAEELNELEMARLQQENADYEKRLQSSGRACYFNDSDIEWLRQP